MFRQVIFYKLKPEAKRTMDDVLRVVEFIQQGQEKFPGLRAQCTGLTDDPIKDDISIIGTVDFDSIEVVRALKTHPPALQFFHDMGNHVSKVQVFNITVVESE